jgi:hypothetical protein
MTDEPESLHFRQQLGAWRLANLLASLFVIFLGLVSPYLKLHGRPPMRLPFAFGPIIPFRISIPLPNWPVSALAYMASWRLIFSDQVLLGDSE